MSLILRQVGKDTSWQDAGRPGYLHRGVPPGGPMDRESFGWATQLTNSKIALEVGPFGLIAEATTETSLVVVGAERPIRVDGREVEGQGVIRLKSGQRIELGYPTLGARSYLALGGLVPPEGGWLGSISGVPAARGDVIEGPLELPLRRLTQPLKSLAGALLVIPGPQHELFEELIGRVWKASTVMDRTGIRLDGEPIPLPEMGSLTSEPQVVGTIQLTSGGTPILIGPDGPTIGGYAKPAILTSASRDRMGQLKPGDPVMLVGLGT